jgi:toxin ParE1/3/4
MVFKIRIDSRAIEDIQQQVIYYNKELPGLGKRFFEAVDLSFLLLKSTPFFQVRYDKVRCLPVKRFPFLIHFTVDEEKKIVFIHGVIHTSLNPKKHWVKRPKR